MRASPLYTSEASEPRCARRGIVKIDLFRLCVLDHAYATLLRFGTRVSCCLLDFSSRELQKSNTVACFLAETNQLTSHWCAWCPNYDVVFRKKTRKSLDRLVSGTSFSLSQVVHMTSCLAMTWSSSVILWRHRRVVSSSWTSVIDASGFCQRTEPSVAGVTTGSTAASQWCRRTCVT